MGWNRIGRIGCRCNFTDRVLMLFHCELKSIKVHCIVGLYPFERLKPQKLLFDLSYSYSHIPTDQPNLLGDTPDYVAVGNCLTNFVRQKQFYLLETLLDESSEHLLSLFPSIKEVKIKVHKPAADPHHSGPQLFLKKNRK